MGKLIILGIGAVLFVLLIVYQLIKLLWDDYDDWLLKRRIERIRRNNKKP